MNNPLASIVPKYELTEPEFHEWLSGVEKRLVAEAEFESREKNLEKLNELMPLTHTFTPGLYTRQIFMPKGTLLTSRIHMHEHPFIVSKGSVSVYDGKQIVTYEAPHQGITKPGTKRLLYINEDTLWTTFHVTDMTTVEELETEGVLVCDSFEKYSQLVNKEITL